jgi:predicted O-methyltransferase YrrM
MRIKDLVFYAKHPKLIIDQIRFKIWLKLNPDAPWISPRAVEYLNLKLDKGMNALEWGSGRSSIWYAKRVGKLLSIEHNKRWYELVEAKMKEGGVNNAEIRQISLNHPEDEPTRNYYDATPKYVGVVDEYDNNSLDFVAIDGHYRGLCVNKVKDKIKKGGYLLIDNSNWIPIEQWGIPKKGWEIVHQSSNGVTQTTIWVKNK